MDRAATAVEQWARERPGLPALPMEIFGRLSDASERVMRDHMNPLFAQAGLQPGEFDVLATLRRSGKPYLLSPTQLYEALMISSGGMTNRLDRLERAGLVERRPDPMTVAASSSR
jgi:DNA-binding MarR family transcriptional regulator